MTSSPALKGEDSRPRWDIKVRGSLTSQSTDEDSSDPNTDESDGLLEPAVEEGERRSVEINDLGEQGDGIASVERGYIIIVPDTEPQERVTVEVTSVIVTGRRTHAYSNMSNRASEQTTRRIRYSQRLENTDETPKPAEVPLNGKRDWLSIEIEQ